ncbi:tripartite tricarboxylate transporter substrate binding protein [bacterium LRH843]|nr:tripartite tricarboxylate transporter substrate binding protein [bacterium LRH843]
MKTTLKSRLAMIFMLLVASMLIIGCSGQKETGSAGGGAEAPAEKPAEEETEKEAKVDYPKKPIQVVVPAGAGGDTDANARVLAKYLEKELGQPLVVTNVGGAGGTVGSKEVLDAENDGYKVLFFHNSMLLNHILGLSDFSVHDFELAGISVFDEGNTFLVNGASKYETLTDLIEDARANPGEVSIATEIGGFTHLQLLALEKDQDIELNIVDVGGAADKITALLGGHIDIVPTSLGLVKGYLESGDMRTLGIMAAERVDLMPDTPTFAEQGVDSIFEKIFFYAFPPETPKEIVEVFSKAMENVAANEEYLKEANEFLVTGKYMGPEEATEYIKNAEEYYKGLLEE